jgi:hypothetical protein
MLSANSLATTFFTHNKHVDPKSRSRTTSTIHGGSGSRARSSATTRATLSFSTRAPSTRGSKRRPTLAPSTTGSSTRPRIGPPAGSTRTRRVGLDGRTSTPRSRSSSSRVRRPRARR